MSEIRTRSLLTEDIPTLLNLVEGMPQFRIETVEEIRQSFLSSDTSTLVAEYNKRPVGFICYTVKNSEAEIDWLAVDNSVQGKGIGAELMGEFIRKAKEAGVHSVKVAVLASTVEFEPFARTRKFYEKHGFKETQIDKDYYAPGDDRGIMTLNIA